jgi:hypothetical protein
MIANSVSKKDINLDRVICRVLALIQSDELLESKKVQLNAVLDSLLNPDIEVITGFEHLIQSINKLERDCEMMKEEFGRMKMSNTHTISIELKQNENSEEITCQLRILGDYYEPISVDKAKDLIAMLTSFVESKENK